MGLRRTLVAATVAATLLAGCSGKRPEPKPTPPSNATEPAIYVGDIDASAASIWLQVKGGSVTGAVCQDARPSLRFDPAKVKAGKAALAYGGSVVGTLSITADEAVGTVELSGKKHKFRAQSADVMGDVCGRP